MDDSTASTSRHSSRNPTPIQTDDEVERDMAETTDTEEEDSDDEDVVINPTWCATTQGLRKIPFTKVATFMWNLPVGSKPIEFFNLMVDEIFLENIVRLTNKKAEDIFLVRGHKERARISDWKPVSVDELKVFLGLLLHTGTIKLNKLNDYWKKHWLFSIPAFKNYMARDRFLNILRCLSFSTPPQTEAERNNRLFKINDVISYFNLKMDQIYYPGKELSLDESMILWRGRLIFRQYLKGKRHKYGIKLYTLAEPEGLVLRFFVYAGKNDETSGKGHASKVVMKLMQGKLGVGHSLYLDNFYNSFHLASLLFSNDTYCTGTLRQDRKDTPAEVKAAKLSRGETIARYSDGIMIGAWKDKRKVVYISSEFENDMGISINKRGYEREKPLPIIQYNAHMKGIDRGDQMLSYHPIDRKTVRWYMKVFEHTLTIMMSNAMHLHNYVNKENRMSLYDFRLAVLEVLLPRPERPGRTPERVRQERHTMQISEDRNPDGRMKRKRCRVCHSEKKTKFTPYYCLQCPDQPGLCPSGCFEVYHDNL